MKEKFSKCLRILDKDYKHFLEDSMFELEKNKPFKNNSEKIRFFIDSK